MKKKIFVLIGSILILGLVVWGVFKMQKNNNDKDIKYVNDSYNLNLIKTVNISKNENYLISPYSIEIALRLLKEGADNNTLKEIEDLIGTRSINDVSVKNRVSVANAAFVKDEYKDVILDSFYKGIKTKYDSEILYDEFRTPKVINDWVNKKTNGMIEEILDDIDRDFVLGLANALAIDVEWASEFECTSTVGQKFTKANGGSYDTEMMHQTFRYGGVKYLSSDDAKGVIIPYKKYNDKGEEEVKKGSNLEFLAILPNGNLHNYINDLTEEKLKELDDSAKEADEDFEVRVALPRFKYDYELDDFKQVLISLGIKDAFDELKADFTKIVPRNNRSDIENLYVGEAIHKTHIDLNEKGTKAAAVTYFGVFKTTGIEMEHDYVEVTFDKPFMYIIRDSETKEMLFFGTVYEPNKWTGSTCLEGDN